MKTKKIILIAIIITCCALFTACANFEITAKIDENNYASYTIQIEVDTSEMDYWDRLKKDKMLNAFRKHLKNDGFTADKDSSSGLEIHKFEKKEQAESSEEAFKLLETMLTSDTSILSTYNYELDTSHDYVDYKVDATVSLEDIFYEEYIEEIPDTTKNIFLKNIEDTNIKFTFITPKSDGNEIPLNIQTPNTFDLNIGESTTMSFEGRIANSPNILEYNRLTELKAAERKKMLIFASAILFIIALMIIIIRSKPKHYNKNPNDKRRKKLEKKLKKLQDKKLNI